MDRLLDCVLPGGSDLQSLPLSRASEYLDLIVRTHRSFPSADVWLRYDRGFRRKVACSPVPLEWGSTDLEVFHQAYASSNVLQPGALSSQSFCRSGELPQGSEAQGSSSAAEICRTWKSGHCTSGFAFCRPRASLLHQVPHLLPPPSPPLASSTAAPLTNRRRWPLLSLLRSHYLWLVAVCRPVLRHFVVPGLLQPFCARP